MDLIVNLNPASVLDIGIGFGKYGFLCREYLELWDGRENYSEFLRRIDGVEVFENYITPMHDFVYNHLYVRDISKIIDELNFSYDLVLLVDVLEHFNKCEGKVLLTKILGNNKGVLISTPKNPSNQKDAFNNIYETHRARWTKQELSSLHSSSSSSSSSSSFFIRDSTHLIAYIGRKESVKRLARKLAVRYLKKVPAMPFLIQSYLRFAKKAGILSIVPFLSFFASFQQQSNNNILDGNTTMVINQMFSIVNNYISN
jgi:hypothetical protein